MPYHYRIINKYVGEIRQSSEGKREAYDTRMEALGAGEKLLALMGYSASRNKVVVVPAERDNEQTNF